MKMSKVVVRSGPGFSGSLAVLRLLAAGSDVRSWEESPRRAPEEPATVDAVAGSEFLDDRIRLQE
jgi:hypothetical protein